MAKKPNPFAGKETKAEEKAEMKGKGKMAPPFMKGKSTGKSKSKK